jgi:transketolase
MKKTPGVDLTTGSLGQGLSGGVGMALGLKQDSIPAKVYVVLGDGELNEGQIWEDAMSAAKFKLDNLIAFVDFNDLQIDGYSHDVMPIEPIVDKWDAFNWEVLEINGHAMQEIIKSIEKAHKVGHKPTVIIAHTIKGKGVSFMENECDWHGIAPNHDQYIQAMQELGVKAGDPILRKLNIYQEEFDKIAQTRRESLATLEILKSSGIKPMATRDAFGEVLAELGAEIPNFVVLEADISKSTRTRIFAEK